MSRPPLEVADLIRSAGAAFIERNRQWIRWKHVKVLLAIARCRTAALGGHVDQCTRCGHRATISYNSCRNRHCPKCQTAARERWIAARQKELLPTRYVHVVFTLPAPLAPSATTAITSELPTTHETIVSAIAIYQQLALLGELYCCRGKGWPEGSIRRAVSLGHLHACQTISEVQATSIVPKNK